MIVYTIIHDDYDELKDPWQVPEGIEWIVFSDTEQRSSVWKWEKYTFPKGVRSQRELKILGHEILGSKQTLYVDGSISIRGDVRDLMKYNRKPLALYEHLAQDDCIYEEAQRCIRQSKDSTEIIEKQMAKYLKAGYPKNNGLIATGMILRKGEKYNKYYHYWMNEINRYSLRDQLSFNFIAWKYNFSYWYLSYEYFRQYFKIGPHWR